LYTQDALVATMSPHAWGHLLMMQHDQRVG